MYVLNIINEIEVEIIEKWRTCVDDNGVDDMNDILEVFLKGSEELFFQIFSRHSTEFSVKIFRIPI